MLGNHACPVRGWGKVELLALHHYLKQADFASGSKTKEKYLFQAKQVLQEWLAREPSRRAALEEYHAAIVAYEKYKNPALQGISWLTGQVGLGFMETKPPISGEGKILYGEESLKGWWERVIKDLLRPELSR